MTKVTGNWLENAATQAVFKMLERGGAQAFFVGGCVRNALLGEPVNDIDISTDAVPDTVIELAENAGLKAIPTGYDHGTITVVSSGIAHEITTFRKDVETDGRHAKVVFSPAIEDDAARRDFTMNALYAQSDGSVVDPLGGLVDLMARNVRFIGSAQDRIREDYLRSLRYFRFHAWYGNLDNGFDPDALSAISQSIDGLARVSRERIGAEILKLLSAQDPAAAIAGMRSTNVLAAVLPGSDDRFLAALVHIEAELGLSIDPIRRLAILGGADVAQDLRLSKAQAKALDQFQTALSSPVSAAELGYRLGQDVAFGTLALRAATSAQPVSKNDLKAVKKGSNAVFPVTSGDLMPTYQGQELGQRLTELERIWIASGFGFNRDELLSQP